jgi:DNA-binding NtrC family response regulator
MSAPDSPGDLTTGHILIVEDECAIRADLVDQLRAGGFAHVLEAASGDQALDILADHSGIEIVVTDVLMPGRTDGLALLAWVRANRPQAKVVLMGHWPARSQHGSADLAFPKPVKLQELMSGILQLLGRRAA